MKACCLSSRKYRSTPSCTCCCQMLTPLALLERVPTFKEQQQELKDRDLSTYGFLGYPLLQTADIIIYKANWVPVGADQVVPRRAQP